MVVLKQEKRLKSTYGSPATQIQEPWPSRTMAQDGSSGLNAPCTLRCQTWMEILHFYRWCSQLQTLIWWGIQYCHAWVPEGIQNTLTLLILSHSVAAGSPKPDVVAHNLSNVCPWQILTQVELVPLLSISFTMFAVISSRFSFAKPACLVGKPPWLEAGS